MTQAIGHAITVLASCTRPRHRDRSCYRRAQAGLRLSGQRPFWPIHVACSRFSSRCECSFPLTASGRKCTANHERSVSFRDQSNVQIDAVSLRVAVNLPAVVGAGCVLHVWLKLQKAAMEGLVVVCVCVCARARACVWVCVRACVCVTQGANLKSGKVGNDVLRNFRTLHHEPACHPSDQATKTPRGECWK